jgi:hypothetical protein
LIDKRLIKSLTRESGIETEPILREDVQSILVEVIANKVGIFAVRFSAMDEEQSL